jgi:hypothetical protein
VDVCGMEIRIQVKAGLIRIAHLAAEGFEFVDDPDVLLEALRKPKAPVDLFSFIQQLPDTSPKYGYPFEWDNVAALPVSSFDHWWTRQINPKTRNMVRRAQKKGVEVREVPFDDALIQTISKIYNESPVRQGKPFTHYGKDLESLRREHATFLDQSIFIGAFLGEEPIGFVKLVVTQHQAGLMQIVSMIGHRDKAPTNALIAQAVRSCAERAIPYLVYDRFPGGKKEQDSLSEFKRHNGFQCVDLPRYNVPLTLAGRMALSLGLHRRFVDHLPETMLARLREIRNLWYTRRVRAAAGAG